jgi:inosine-uridine nucleoside N-ribohydrolase
VDDVLALMLALASSPEEIELLLISVTYGNVEVERCCIQISILVTSWLTDPQAAYETLWPSSTLLRRSWSGEELMGNLRALKRCTPQSQLLLLALTIPWMMRYSWRITFVGFQKHNF